MSPGSSTIIRGVGVIGLLLSMSGERTGSSGHVSIEVHANAESLPIGIFFRQSKYKGGRLIQTTSLMTGVDAPFRLTEEDHIRW